MSEE
jgi:hypothetical protein